MNEDKLIPVILCGGKGSRLWPLSRESFPKQYINLEEKNNRTMLQNTYERLIGLENLDKPIIICNEEHRFIAAEQIRAINIKPKTILLEPFGRGTAAAVTLAALKAIENEIDPHLLILSSDHSIKNQQNFQKSIKEGVKFSKQSKLVTFGTIPEYPEVGYGYIKTKNPIKRNAYSSEIIQFFEKPNLENAKKYLEDRHFAWNSGIFLFKASVILKEIKKYHPEIFQICKDSIKNSNLDLDFQRIDKTIFEECINLSLDVAVMEKTSRGLMISLDAGWKDIGSWNKVLDNSKKDINGNFVKGKVVSKDLQNCYVRGENRLLVCVGLKNLIIVETNDAILVIDKNQTQEVKKIVEELERKNYKEGKEHKKIFRPWGYYSSLVENSKWQVKKIVVNPNQALSLQMHNFRSEHWVVVSGRAQVEIDSKISIINENQSAYIPIKSKHRLSNPNSDPLVLIEVQSGNYISENDIVRFEDSYGRVEKGDD